MLHKEIFEKNLSNQRYVTPAMAWHAQCNETPGYKQEEHRWHSNTSPYST